MHLVALALAAAGMVAVWLPAPGMYVAMSCGILGAALARVVFRQRYRPGAARLYAAGALTIAMMALTLAALRYVFTLIAIGKLESML